MPAPAADRRPGRCKQAVRAHEANLGHYTCASQHDNRAVFQHAYDQRHRYGVLAQPVL